MHKRKETEDDRRLLEAAQDVLGMKGEMDLNETFPQSNFGFPGYIAFKGFIDQAGTKALREYLQKYEQEAALAGLQLLYMNDLVDMEKVDKIGAIMNGSHTLAERYEMLKLERQLVPEPRLRKLYTRMNDILRNNVAELRIAYGYREKQKVMAYLASAMIAETVDSVLVPAVLDDQRAVERAIQTAMIDLNPNFFKKRR